MIYRIITPHRVGCNALRHTAEGIRKSPWSHVHPRDVPGVTFRDRLGRHHNGATTVFFAISCNDPDCPAIALVNISEELARVK